jgi:hypothetical protein
MKYALAEVARNIKNAAVARNNKGLIEMVKKKIVEKSNTEVKPKITSEKNLT